MLGQVGEDRAASPIKLTGLDYMCYHKKWFWMIIGPIIDQSIAQQSVDL